MMKAVFSLVAIIAVGSFFASLAGGERDSTKGGIRDREAASEVIKCAKQYDEKGMWLTCLHIAADRQHRKHENVARHVNRMVGQTVFAVEE